MSIIACFAMMSCEKDITVNQENDSPEEIRNDLSKPLEFSSKGDLVDAINAFDPDAPSTRAIVTGFVSYYDSVMQEEGYDERPNAILSDAFGSILNPDGEVIFDDTFLKVGLKGIIYGPVEEMDYIRSLALSEDIDMNSFEKVIIDDHEEYRSNSNTSVFLSDTFGLLADNKNQQSSDSGLIISRADIATYYTDPTAGVIWGDTEVMNASRMDNDYTWPSGSDQKTKFSSKVANDTKIYKQHYAGVYDESGVKTKTMKKKGIFWNKFTADVTSAVVTILIHESGIGIAASLPLGWLDVSKTHYKGESFMIATKVVGSYNVLPKTPEELESDCSAAYNWAKQNGADVSDVEGIRYIVASDPNNVAVRIRDIVVKKHAAKNTLIFNLLTNLSSFYTDPGKFGKFTCGNAYYSVDLITYYGFSEYNNEKRGFKLTCARYSQTN